MPWRACRWRPSCGRSRREDLVAWSPGRSRRAEPEIGAENHLALAYAGYGRLHKQQGHIAGARDYLIRALEIFERLGTLIEPDRVRQEVAGLPPA